MADGSMHGSSGYDVIVVGAGSAGCLIAGRLAAETDARVLLLEDGGRDSSPFIRMPAGYFQLLAHKRSIYPYQTVPQRHLGGRRVLMVQGRGLGGSSSINAMVYMRGQPRDYDGWQKAAGGDGSWSFADLLPHFTAMEGNDILSGRLHGANGPLKVSQPLDITPLNQAVIKAFQESGLPYNPDYNGVEQRGVSPCQLTIHDGRRCSAAYAFLHPAEDRPNLTIVTDALATRILLEGDRAVGVEFVRDGEVQQVLAAEIVLSAGALNTPRLLMLSGIGPEAELARHGIACKVRAPDVGHHLQDHPQVPVIARSHKDLGYTGDVSGFGALKAGLQYIAVRSGPAASNGIESVAHFNPEDLAGEPTVQCFHVPVVAEVALGAPDEHPGVTLENVVLQPKSRGQLTLLDSDPRSEPLIDPNYLGEPEDMRTMILGLRYVREVLQAPSLKDILEPERLPGLGVQSDADLIAYARERMSCMLHPVGTCRMGADEDSVVDPSLRVRGVRGLRIIDASIMPNIVSANTNAPVLALASKGLELLRRDMKIGAPLQASSVSANVPAEAML